MTVNNSKAIKTAQLGMDPGTASGRLVKDLLWNYICKAGDNHCCHCNEEMTRDTFSIEHLTPWLHSDNPLGLFFDLNNIKFSHLSCNIKAKDVVLKLVVLLQRTKEVAVV